MFVGFFILVLWLLSESVFFFDFLVLKFYFVFRERELVFLCLVFKFLEFNGCFFLRYNELKFVF